MKILLRILAVLVGLGLVLFVGLYIFMYHFFASGGLSLCGEELISESVSPDGKYVAAVYIRNCGATTGYVTHVNVRRHDEEFSADSSGVIRQGGVFLVKGSEKTKIEWRIGELEILYGGEKVTRRYP
ncbi:MAG: DUF5412 family protein [Nevskiales bacterium]